MALQLLLVSGVPFLQACQDGPRHRGMPSIALAPPRRRHARFITIPENVDQEDVSRATKPQEPGRRNPGDVDREDVVQSPAEWPQHAIVRSETFPSRTVPLPRRVTVQFWNPVIMTTLVHCARSTVIFENVA
jgi:hypothetical protein